ncbi:hypothetical protein MJO29_014601 [Puccinia striiformis f. sp. tritici]|nr:hypothetical protein MJO29_014601 [Puccinia striiformis f. sp. tritici]
MSQQPMRYHSCLYATESSRKLDQAVQAKPRVRGVDQVVVEAKPRVKYAPLVSSPLVTSRSQLTPCPKSVAFNARIELRHTLQYPHLTASSSHSFRLDVRGLKISAETNPLPHLNAANIALWEAINLRNETQVARPLQRPREDDDQDRPAKRLN